MTGVLGGIIGSMKGATAPKTAPTSLSAVPSSTSVAISFTAPSDDGGSPITNYEYSFNNSTWTALSPADSTSPITISGLSPGYTTYSVWLRAVNIIGFGPTSSSVTFTTPAAPSASFGGVFDKTESRATLLAGISANGLVTTVYFQYNTTNNFASYTQVNAGTTILQGTSVSYTVTGLPTNATLNGNGYTFYVRVVAVNSVGTTTSAVTSWQSWGVRQLVYQSAGTVYVPTVPGVVPGALPVVVLIGGGGGGGRWGGGGGAGGLTVRYNWAFSGTSGEVSYVCGGGGGGNGSGSGGGGTSSYISGANLGFVQATGGTGGADQGYGGNVGSGDNPAYTGGAPFIVSGKGGYTYGGGGAGNDGYGGNATGSGGGPGGPGNGFWGNSGGGGGAVGGTNTGGAHGSPNNVGAGGDASVFGGRGSSSGATGVVVFQYWGT